MWLDNLIKLKNKEGKTSKQIAEGTFMSERTVSRIFHRETDNPTITTIIPIINFLGGSFDEIFADTNAVIGDKNLATLQDNIALITAERDSIIAENKILADKIAVQTKEIELLNIKLMYTEKLLATHDYYNKLNPNK